ncbi:MAG: DUF4230 domain-containing protein [Prevotella sp.]|nr:DUF4230 domain-containing protein [Prevotella sp.]
MENPRNKSRNIFDSMTRILGISLLLVLMVITAVVFLIFQTVRGCSAGMEESGRIAITPVQIAKIQDIGQWEFLSISDEELMDTVRHGFFGDDELARIYYGTLRLGIDLHDAQEGWIKMDHDTVSVTLPPVRLLDEKFVDEARTQAFYEKGKWSEADKHALTQRAMRAMKARCLTESNIRSAEQNATSQFSILLKSMGFEYTRIRFKDKTQKSNT